MTPQTLRKSAQWQIFSLWTYGESDPELVHAMDVYYRYTIGPNFFNT